jgi:hypothetical protein
MPIVYSPRRPGSPKSPRPAYHAKLYVFDDLTCRDSIRAHLANVGASLGDRNDLPEADNSDQGGLSMSVLMKLFQDLPESQFASTAAIKDFLGIEDVDEVIGTDDQVSHESTYNACVKWAEERREVVRTET